MENNGKKDKKAVIVRNGSTVGGVLGGSGGILYVKHLVARKSGAEIVKTVSKYGGGKLATGIVVLSTTPIGCAAIGAVIGAGVVYGCYKRYETRQSSKR